MDWNNYVRRLGPGFGWGESKIGIQKFLILREKVPMTLAKPNLLLFSSQNSFYDFLLFPARNLDGLMTFLSFVFTKVLCLKYIPALIGIKRLYLYLWPLLHILYTALQ